MLTTNQENPESPHTASASQTVGSQVLLRYTLLLPSQHHPGLPRASFVPQVQLVLPQCWGQLVSSCLLAWAPLPFHTIPAGKPCCRVQPQCLQPVRWAQHEPEVFVLFLCIVSGLGWLLCWRAGVPESWAMNLCLYCVKCACLRNSSCEVSAPCILPCYPWL